jgi:hypothetical protein
MKNLQNCLRAPENGGFPITMQLRLPKYSKKKPGAAKQNIPGEYNFWCVGDKRKPAGKTRL